MDPDNFLFNPNSRKYFFVKLAAPYNLELECGSPSGWMHINGIYIRYGTKNNPDENKFGKIFFMDFLENVQFSTRIIEKSKKCQ